MTLALLSQFWPIILGVLGALFGVFKHQQTKAAKATAGEKASEAAAAKIKADSAKAEADASKEALARVQNASKERATIDAQVKKEPDLDAALKNGGFTE